MAPSDPQTTQTRRFDPAAYLTTDEHRMAYLEAVLETKEVRFILDACVVVARSIAVLCSAPRWRVSPVEGGSTQRVVDCSGS